MSLEMKKVREINGIIRLQTGLHIGSGSEQIHIGGIDGPVIKHPFTYEPYIPGSSLKGKLRTLLEWKYNKIGKNGGPCSCGSENCFVCRIFGTSNQEKKSGPTRLIVRDCFLSKEWKKKLEAGEISHTDLYEAKTEIAMDRLKGCVGGGGPRTFERVIAGVSFRLDMVYRIFDEQDEKNLKYIKEALDLLQNDYLGGNGSRGYGKVVIENLNI